MKGASSTGLGVWEGKRAPIRRVTLYLFTALVFGFLLLPNFFVVPLSVSDSIFLQFPPEGFTWRWYQDYFGVEGASYFGTTGRWIPATLISVELAILVILLAIPVGTLAAYGLSRGNYKGKTFLNAIIISPLIVPLLITAIALFFFLSDTLRSFFKPLPGPPVPVWGEWVMIVMALLLGIGALTALLLTRFYKGPMIGRRWEIYESIRPWTLIVLAATIGFFLLPWASGASDQLPGGLFNGDDPIPPIPMVSPGLLLAHVMLAVPYVVIILSATLRSIDETQDMASYALGAGPFTTLRRVILPAMIPGLAAAAFFCFIVSFDELLLALFLSTTEISTLPKEMWDGIRTEVSPTIAAISTMLIILTIALLSIGYIVQMRLRQRSGAAE